MFSRRTDGSVYLAWREYITQVGTLASLVLDYGWPSELVALDPRSVVFDLAGFDSPAAAAPMMAAGETKKTQRELATLLRQMEAAGSSVGVSEPQRASTDGEKKYRGLLTECPRYFWAVAPGVRRAFRLTYQMEAASLEEIGDLPPYSSIANGV